MGIQLYSLSYPLRKLSSVQTAHELSWDNYVQVSGVGWVDLPPVFRYKEVCIPVTTYQ